MPRFTITRITGADLTVDFALEDGSTETHIIGGLSLRHDVVVEPGAAFPDGTINEERAPVTVIVYDVNQDLPHADRDALVEALTTYATGLESGRFLERALAAKAHDHVQALVGQTFTVPA